MVPSEARQSKLCNTVHTLYRRVGKPRWLWCNCDRKPLRPATTSSTAFNASHRLTVRLGQRVRDRCSCQYIRGNTHSATHSRHLGVRETGDCPSCHTACHHRSTRAVTPERCWQTLSKVFFLSGNPWVATHVSRAATSACTWHATSCDVWGIDPNRRHGCMMSDRGSR